MRGAFPAAERRVPLAEPILCGNLLDFARRCAPRLSLLDRAHALISYHAMPSVKELRAAAAALGLQTTGMEKHELEAAVAAAEAAEASPPPAWASAWAGVREELCVDKRAKGCY